MYILLLLLCWLFQFSLDYTRGANADDVGAWQQYVSEVWVSDFSHFGSQFWSKFGPTFLSFWYPKAVPNPRFMIDCCEKVPETGAFSSPKMGPFWVLERDPFLVWVGTFFGFGWAFWLAWHAKGSKQCHLMLARASVGSFQRPIARCGARIWLSISRSVLLLHRCARAGPLA